MSATGERCPREAGFTLLEVLVTMAILALISGIAFPALQRLIGRQNLTQARGALALAVARARSEAIRSDSAVRVVLADGGDTLLIARTAAPTMATPLPQGATVEWPRGGVVIFGDGSANGASGIVHAGTALSRFAIDPATARLDFTP